MALPASHLGCLSRGRCFLGCRVKSFLASVSEGPSPRMTHSLGRPNRQVGEREGDFPEGCLDPAQSLAPWPVQFSSVAQSCPTLCDPMDCSTPGLPVHHKLPEPTQTHVHRGSDAIQPSHPLSSPSPPAPNPSQHQGLFQWVNSSHQVAKVLEFQLQHQSFQWIFRTDFL